MGTNIQLYEDASALREKVRERYSQSALRVSSGGCCGGDTGSGCCGSDGDGITGNLYSAQDAGLVPQDALAASLGCGNPTLLAKLNPGDTVLDLGSGGGIDVLLSARRVGPEGFVYGLDMTDEMLALAEKNRAEAGVENVRFLKGYIEEVPLPDNAVDVVISNCVINLAADKGRVLREAFRVLKPGGRFAVSDIVVQGEAPESILRSMEAWTGCIAGALPETTYRNLLAEAGFTGIEVQVTRRYSADTLVSESGCCSPINLSDAALAQADGLFVSAFVRATKPEVL
ncbi:MAG TPA: arsenite methyltransferase [Chloroflexia bacterium]|nr:arsenite methyltransferase [Chloroflexia bacterium]